MNSVAHSAIPLVVDLDGTLLLSDLLLETTALLMREQTWKLPALLPWLARGKPYLKHQLARSTDLDVQTLPYNAEVLALIAEARQAGRPIVLATASHRLLADRVAQHLGVFDEVLATEGSLNLSSSRKQAALVARFGEKGFDYVGNSADDLVVWRSARQAFLANAPESVRRRAQAMGNVARVLGQPATAAGVWSRALRLHQWLKNLLLFLPMLAAHRLLDLPLAGSALLAFLCFGMCASSVYLLNDLLDLQDDRHHPRKRFRPFAAGQLSIGAGLLAFPLLLTASFTLALWLLPWAFATVLLCYYVLTLSYSLLLKRMMVVDVITLATLYTLRILAGGAAVGLSVSFWLLAFSMFMFLSLALIKRYAELHHLRGRGSKEKARGRGYEAADLDMLASLGAAAGYMSVMVLALYINDGNTVRLYRHPQFIWLACPLMLTWITRAWMIAHRGRMHDDPVLFAVKDRASLLIAAAVALVFWAAA